MANTATRTWRYAAPHLAKLKFTGNRLMLNNIPNNPLFLQNTVTEFAAERQQLRLNQQRSCCSRRNDATELLWRSGEDVRMIKEQRFSMLAEDIRKTRAQLSCKAAEAWMIREQIAHLWQQYSYISELVSKIETGVVPRLAKEVGKIDEQRFKRLAEDAVNVRKELESSFDNEIAQITDQLWSRGKQDDKNSIIED